MAGEEFVRKETLEALTKGINGDLTDIKGAVRDLTATMNRRFDALDQKFETERAVGRDAHQRIHERIEGVSDSLAVEMAGVGEEFGRLKDGHWSKGTAALVAVLSSACVGLLVAFLTKL